MLQVVLDVRGLDQLLHLGVGLQEVLRLRLTCDTAAESSSENIDIQGVKGSKGQGVPIENVRGIDKWNTNSAHLFPIYFDLL